MPQPALKVEISFVSAPLATSPTWVDVTAYVRDSPGVSISRGRQSSTGTFSPGSCTFSLDNRDRRFDPQYASSPYNGYLTPRRQVRVTATANAVATVIFQGHLTGWPTAYPFVGRDSTVRIEAFDGLAWLAETIIPDAVYAYANGLGDLSSFFRYADTATWADEQGAGDARLTQGVGAVGTSPLAKGLTSEPVVFNPPTNWAAGPRNLSSSTFTMSFWLKTTSTGLSSTAWMSLLGAEVTGKYLYRVGIDDTGAVRYIGNDASPTFRAEVSSSIPVNDGQPHHVVIAHDGNTSLRCYVDGVDVSTGPAIVYAGGIVVQYIGAAMGTTSDYNFTGELSDVAFYRRVLTAAQVATLYGLGAGALAESTGTRLTRILDAVGWPASWRDQTITSGLRGECYELNLTGKSALAAGQEVADTEQGGLYATPTNKVCLLSRYHSQEATVGKTSQATFSDDGSDIPYTRFAGFDTRDIDMANDVSVSSVWGTRQASNATSITNYGRQSTSVSTLLANVNLVADMANGIVAARKDPQIRSGSFSVALGALTAAQQSTVLGLDCGERITMEITPSGVGSQIVKPLILDRVDHDISADEWTVSLAGSPVPFGFFLLDSSALDTGVLGY
jgi:hypothetical protein